MGHIRNVCVVGLSIINTLVQGNLVDWARHSRCPFGQEVARPPLDAKVREDTYSFNRLVSYSCLNLSRCTHEPEEE